MFLWTRSKQFQQTFIKSIVQLKWACLHCTIEHWTLQSYNLILKVVFLFQSGNHCSLRRIIFKYFFIPSKPFSAFLLFSFFIQIKNLFVLNKSVNPKQKPHLNFSGCTLVLRNQFKYFQFQIYFYMNNVHRYVLFTE